MSRSEHQEINEVTGQRADCPHAPHDFSCGPIHGDICAFAHRGGCEAVHPICPACQTAHPRVVVSAIAHAVAADGVRVSGCNECDQITFRYDADLFCPVCKWLVPDVNDKLAERYMANGGAFAADPGECPGCRQTGAGHPLTFPITCPACGTSRMVSQESVSKTTETAVRCTCRYVISVPPDVWCPSCRLNLRSLHKITALIKQANEPDNQWGENLKEPPLDRTARRVIGYATVAERRARAQTSRRQNQMLTVGQLDLLVFNEGQIADWMLDHVKLRAIGQRLARDGGADMVAAVADRVAALEPRILRYVEDVWDGIGDIRSSRNPAGDNLLVDESWARELIIRHMARVVDAGNSLTRRPGWATLSGEAAISFASTAHDGAMRQFDDVYVVVSHVHETDPERIRQIMSGSYLIWADTVTGFTELLNQSDFDVAHWLLCADWGTHSVHLGYFAPATGGAILPTDLIPSKGQQGNAADEPEVRRPVELAGRPATERDIALDEPDLLLIQAVVRARHGDLEAAAVVRTAIDIERRRWGAPTAPYASALESILNGTSTQAMINNDLTASQVATLFAIVDAIADESS